MIDNKATDAADDELIAALEKAVLDILSSPKSKPAEKLSAVANGIKLLATRHSIRGGDAADFFASDSK